MRRFFTFLLLGLGLLGLLWAASLRLTHPIDQHAAKQGPRRFELTVSEAQANQPSAVDYAHLDARLRQLMQDPRMIALAVAVVENGQIRFAQGYGETVAGSGDPVTTDTVFRWASLSKGVAADMVALLADQHRLSLNEPVGSYAASLHLPGGNERTATVADLLSHQLGLFSHAQDPKLEDGWDPKYLRSTLASLHNICAPGTCWAYQNVAYDAASEIVERVTGEPYQQVVRERLFAPLGMRTASLTREGLMQSSSWARPYAGGRGSRPIDVTDSYYRIPAAGGVNGSIGDLAIWMLAQMGEAPDVLPERVLQEVQTPRANTPGETARRRKFRERTQATTYGMGWRIMDYAGHHVVGHHGGVRGYRSMIMFDPQLRSGVVVLWTGSASKPNGIEYEVMDQVYRLPFRDWIGIDERSLEAQPPAEERPENEGGSG